MKLLDRFKRTTNQGGFIPEIDGLRFFAIITVALFHLNTTYAESIGIGKYSTGLLDASAPGLGWCFARMDLGVKVFFAISGFILSLPFLRHYLLGQRRVDVGEYFLRRLKRLEPPFLLSLTVLFVVQLNLGMLHVDRPWAHFIAGVLYNHVLIFGTSSPINPVTWSLETETQFYTIVPILFWMLFKPTSKVLRIVILMLLIAVSVRFREVSYWDRLVNVQHTVLAYLSNFLMGTIFAWSYLEAPRIFQGKSLFWDLVGFCSLWLMFSYYKPQYIPLFNVLFNISILGLFISVFKGRLFNALFTWQPIYTIGGMCYSIYLLHYAIFFVIVPRTAGLTSGMSYAWGLFLQCLIAMPVMLTSTSIFYLLIEKPCMDKDWPTKAIRWVRSRFGKIHAI